MIPALFDYQRASSVDEALAALAQHGEDAKLLAGGHSLLPLMKLRLAMPAVLVDIGRIPDLSYVRGEAARSASGRSPATTTWPPPTWRGSRCRCWPRWPARSATRRSATGARWAGRWRTATRVRPAGGAAGTAGHAGGPGPGGERTIPADDFFTGFLETALAPDEVLTEIRVPAVPGSAGRSRSSSAGPRTGPSWAWPRSWPTARAAPVSAWSTWARAAAGRRRGGRPALRLGRRRGRRPGRGGHRAPEDLNASPEYRRHLVEVLTRRALETAGPSSFRRPSCALCTMRDAGTEFVGCCPCRPPIPPTSRA